MTISEDGTVPAKFPDACTGKVTSTNTQCRYRFDFDCASAKGIMDGVLSEDGQSPDLTEPNSNTTLPYKRRAS